MTEPNMKELQDAHKKLADLDVVAFLNMIKAKAENWIKEMKHGS